MVLQREVHNVKVNKSGFQYSVSNNNSLADSTTMGRKHETYYLRQHPHQCLAIQGSLITTHHITLLKGTIITMKRKH